MKKLTLGHALKETVATCNFCEESGKNCIRGSLKNEFSSPKFISKVLWVGEKPSYKYMTDDYNYSFFGNKYSKNLKIESVIVNPECKAIYERTGEIETEEESSDICFDCIKQLAKLIN